MERILSPTKRITLVAHDYKKRDLVEWARFNRETLRAHELYATGTTGALVERELGLPVHRLKSGPTSTSPLTTRPTSTGRSAGIRGSVGQSGQPRGPSERGRYGPGT